MTFSHGSEQHGIEEARATHHRDHWTDEELQRYVANMEKHAESAYGPLARRIVEVKLRFLDGQRAVLLDVGCGPGFLAFEVMNRDYGIRAIGIDPDPRMIKAAQTKAKARGMTGFLARIGRAEHIPLSRESVDVVVSRRTLHHWGNLSSAFREIRRVLRLNGLLIVNDVNRAYPEWKRKVRYVFLGLLARRDAARHWPGMREHWLSPADVQPLLEDEGFHLEFLDPGADFTLVAQKRSSRTSAKASPNRDTDLPGTHRRGQARPEKAKS
jgi:SAM-dependent methyltransferase